MQPEGAAPEILTSTAMREELLAEAFDVNGNDAQDKMKQKIRKQKQPHDIQPTGHASAEYQQDRTEAVNSKHVRPDPTSFSQGASSGSTSEEDNSNKQPGRQTGIMKIINGALCRILPGDVGQVRQKDRSILHRPEPAIKPIEQANCESSQVQELKFHIRGLENMIYTLRSDLNNANKRVATLGETVAENEAIITQAHATAVSTLAGNVSRGITDDVIREELKKFFQNDFFSWCADLSAESISNGDDVLNRLREVGIINNSEGYWNGPRYLRFSMDSPDGSSPLVLLQAALARQLCLLFLNDAYFLADEMNTKSRKRHRLRRFEQHFSQAHPDAAIDWRIKTVECLEQSVPLTEQYLQKMAHEFVQEYGFLLRVESYDEEADKDLVQIFANFAILALKLWKTRANIEWCDLTKFRDAIFELGHPWVEVDQTLVSRMGQRLTGRPVGLIVRPLIASKSLSKSGKVEEVIWLKALAWVSGEEELMD